MYKDNNSPRFPVRLLWGISLIILLLLLLQTVYIIFSTRFQHQQQLVSLQENLMREQRKRLKAEMNDAEHMIGQMFTEATDLLKRESRTQTLQALQLMNSLYQRYHKQLSEAEMKKLLVEALRDIRFFDGRGYYFIDQMDGTAVLLPTVPQLEGGSLLDNQDDTGHYIMQGLIDAVSNSQQAGFSYYRWYAPDNDQQMKDKIAYAAVFEPYNWIVGTGDYLYRFENDLKPRIYNYIRNIRFGHTGYFALTDNDGTLLASGVTPQLEGVNLIDDTDPRIRDGAESMLDTARKGGGYQFYDWYKSGETDLSKKLSLINPLNNREWILIAGIFQDELNELLSEQKQSRDSELYNIAFNQVIAMTLIGLLALLITLIYSRWLKSRFKRYEDDINRQQAMLQETADSLKLSSLIFESAYEGVIVSDADNRILQVNKAFTRITGYTEDEVIGKSPSVLSSGLQDDVFYQRMWQRLAAAGIWRGEIWNKRKNGEVYPEWLSISLNKDASGNVMNYIAIFYDITQRKELEQQLRSMAETDPLTGLANRRSLMDSLNRDMSFKERYQSPGIALFFVDLDHFKWINDSYGHDVGDSVLIEVANRLIGCLRESDLASRVGGDEFVILCKYKQEDGDQQLQQLSSRLLDQLIKPFRFADIEIDISCSIGVAVHHQGDDAFGLMKSADQALYEAKHQGRGRVVFYADTLNAIASPSPAEAEIR
ncbi:cache domain-containing protein [uncultured Amphritea sp.]|uniref:sensor domain-containing diguanylate cyclase n=1 Tax=uncultured Amphritea sp. TaxID=981605 RepID=UPI0025DCC05E|nr:cache domain-containing protein [uncultured Amphritea sp.]